MVMIMSIMMILVISIMVALMMMATANVIRTPF